MAKIGIVTVLYNSEGVLEEFFRTLDEQTFKDFTLYVIDNASKDNSLVKAIELSKNVSFKTKILPEKENWGIAKGNNIGIRIALADKCEYVLLSNNDLSFCDVDTLDLMVSKIESSEYDIVTPKILLYSNPNIIWAAGGKFNTLETEVTHIGSGEEDQGQFNRECEIDYTPTCFVLIKSDLFSKIGLMDESYFVYWDDTDFMYRVKKNNGRILYFPKTKILHNESSCTGKLSEFSIYQLQKNRLLFAKKHHSLLLYSYVYLRTFLVHHTLHRITLSQSLWTAENRALKYGRRFNQIIKEK